MAKSEIIAGLDIGSTKACTTIAEVSSDGRVEVIGSGTVPSDGMKKGIVVKMDVTTNAIRESVDRAQKMAGCDIRSVVVGVTGEHISSLNSKGVISVQRADGDITHEDVDRVLDASKRIVLPPEREIIHAIPRSFAIDSQGGVKDPVGMSGNRLEVDTHIVTGASTFLQNVWKCVYKAGLSVEDTVLQALATGEAVVMQAEKDLGVALIDIGGGSTDVAVYVEGEIYYSAVVPVGGNHVTADIATMLPTSYEEAERVKIEHGVALESMAEEGSLFEVVRLGAEEPSLLPKKDILAAVIEPRIEEIFSMVKQEIAKSGYLDLLPAGAVITGGGSLIPGTLDMAGQVLGMRVRPGRLIGVHGLVDTVEKPTHATSVGLVIWEKRQMIEHEETHQTGLLSSVLGNIKKRILG